MNAEIMCKNCIYYRPQIGAEVELSGQLEAVQHPFGRCRIMEDPVREDEWCGAYKENEDV